MGRLKDAFEELGKQPLQERELLKQGLNRSTPIRVGEKDGVSVEADIDNERYIVRTQNNYDVYWQLAKRDQNKISYAERLPSEDNSIAVFSIPLERLKSEQDFREFNQKVDQARSTHVEVNKEREEIKYILNFDQAEGKQSVFVFRNPNDNYMVGEVLKTGKYFVAVSAGQNDEKAFFRIMNTSRFLEGKEFMNREEAIAEKLPVGEMKYLKFAEHGRIQIGNYVAKTKAPAVEQLQAPVEAQPAIQPEEAAPGLTEDQKAALMSVKERNPKAWKRDLSTMWETGNYRGLDTDKAASLQQVRNTFGPEWLAKATPKDFALVEEKALKQQPLAM